MLLEYLFFLSLGIAFGAILLYFILQAKQAVLKQQNVSLYRDLEEKKSLLLLKEQDAHTLQMQLTEARTHLNHMHERLTTQKEEVATLQDQMKIQFQNMAHELLQNSSSQIRQQHSQTLDNLLTPLKEKIEKFEHKVDETHKENIRENQSIKDQLYLLQKLNQSIGEEAKNLTQALKGQTKTQGNWGEMILESILEKSGLVKGREYEVQVSLKDEGGKRYQPDVLIRLPDQKTLIVDSKVSLNAYEKYCSAETLELQQIYLKDHLQALRKHIKDLSDKNYQNLYGISTLDFVLIFIPIEPAFNLAIQEDHQLYNEAFDKNIILVSTSTLLATLRTIANIWKQEYQSQNALEIARQGGALYDKFVGFTEDLIAIGKNLQQTQSNYADAMNKLSTGKGNLIKRTEDIKQLGIKTEKLMNQKLLEKSINELSLN